MKHNFHAYRVYLASGFLLPAALFWFWLYLASGFLLPAALFWFFYFFFNRCFDTHFPKHRLFKSVLSTGDHWKRSGVSNSILELLELWKKELWESSFCNYEFSKEFWSVSALYMNKFLNSWNLIDFFKKSPQFLEYYVIFEKWPQFLE